MFTFTAGGFNKMSKRELTISIRSNEDGTPTVESVNFVPNGWSNLLPDLKKLTDLFEGGFGQAIAGVKSVVKGGLGKATINYGASGGFSFKVGRGGFALNGERAGRHVY